MVIDINQKKISFGDKYRIFINGERRYAAATELISFMPRLYLFDNAKSRARLTMEKRWTWFKTRYKVALHDGGVLDFITVSVWRMHHQCRDGEDLYDIYAHKGRKHSVYKNDVQVAWWDKDMVSLFDGDNFRIIADDDCNYELIMGFCLMLDNHNSSNDSTATITFDFGNIGAEARAFDPSWRPKHVQDIA